MKRFLLITFLVFISSPLCFSQSSDQRISELIAKSDYFTLKKEYPRLEKDAHELMQLYATSTINTFFNKPSEANHSINELLTSYSSTIGFDGYVSFVLLMADNFVKLNDWESAVSIYEQLLEQTGQHLDKKQLNEITKRLEEYCIPLKNLPKFEVDLTKTYTIPFKQNEFNHITLPVKINSNVLDFMLDFGADISLIHEKYAKDMGIEYTGDSIHMPSLINGETHIFVKLGIAKEVHIGDMTLQNVPFHITSESIIEMPEKYENSEIKGVIGLSVIRLFKNITFQKKDKMIVVNSNLIKEPAESNMLLFNDRLIVECYNNNDILLMLFDSGSAETHLQNNYYQKHINNQNQWEKSVIGLAGFGGNKLFEVYNLKVFRLEVGTTIFDLDNIPIVVGQQNEHHFAIDGLLGMDIFEKSNGGLLIDFENMIIKYY